LAGKLECLLEKTTVVLTAESTAERLVKILVVHWVWTSVVLTVFLWEIQSAASMADRLVARMVGWKDAK